MTGEWYFIVKIQVKDLEEYYTASETFVKIPELTKVVGMMAPKTYLTKEE